MIVDIAMPTHNCAGWIDDFMKSVLAQQHQDWRVVTYDDQSTDDTRDHVARWAKQLGVRMIVLPNETDENLGPAGSYNRILQATSAAWVMLADPDDVWKPGKMMISLAAMKALEAEFGADRPAIIITDAEIIDDDGERTARSYWRWLRVKPRYVNQFHRLLMESPAISSTMTLNRAVVTRALPISGLYSSQDWWLMLVACAFGRVQALADVTVKHRRHTKNFSKLPLLASNRSVLGKIQSARERLRFLLDKNKSIAKVFLARFADELTEPQRRAAQSAALLAGSPALKRRVLVVRERLWFCHWLKNAALFLLP
ncbi:MAG TPA: glycosyltransferase [Acidocella sp.]|nr:glycosyltransferase [Acidocella sp.]